MASKDTSGSSARSIQGQWLVSKILEAMSAHAEKANVDYDEVCGGRGQRGGRREEGEEGRGGGGGGLSGVRLGLARLGVSITFLPPSCCWLQDPWFREDRYSIHRRSIVKTLISLLDLVCRSIGPAEVRRVK